MRDWGTSGGVRFRRDGLGLRLSGLAFWGACHSRRWLTGASSWGSYCHRWAFRFHLGAPWAWIRNSLNHLSGYRFLLSNLQPFLNLLTFAASALFLWIRDPPLVYRRLFLIEALNCIHFFPYQAPQALSFAPSTLQLVALNHLLPPSTVLVTSSNFQSQSPSNSHFLLINYVLPITTT